MRHFFLKHLIPVLTGITLATTPVFSSAESTRLPAGQYITEAGWGNMSITESKNKTVHFSIEAIGGNVHTCGLEGEIKNQQAVLDAIDPSKPCVIKFQLQDTGINVSSVDSESCSIFCGARAHFEGLYLKPALGCSSKERDQTRKQFNLQYTKKAYSKAYATLEPLLHACEKTLNWLESAGVRNDLAITQYHLGLYSDCQKTLEPVHASIGKTGEKLPKTEQELQDLLPPSDFDNYLPIAKATWHNTKLCTQRK